MAQHKKMIPVKHLVQTKRFLNVPINFLKSFLPEK
jgi:hypothetical protein